MRCEDCSYYWKDICHYDVKDGIIPPCEDMVNYNEYSSPEQLKWEGDMDYADYE